VQRGLVEELRRLGHGNVEIEEVQVPDYQDYILDTDIYHHRAIFTLKNRRNGWKGILGHYNWATVECEGGGNMGRLQFRVYGPNTRMHYRVAVEVPVSVSFDEKPLYGEALWRDKKAWNEAEQLLRQNVKAALDVGVPSLK
jgi:hypothetical protein